MDPKEEQEIKAIEKEQNKHSVSLLWGEDALKLILQRDDKGVNLLSLKEGTVDENSVLDLNIVESTYSFWPSGLEKFGLKMINLAEQLVNTSVYTVVCSGLYDKEPKIYVLGVFLDEQEAKESLSRYTTYPNDTFPRWTDPVCFIQKVSLNQFYPKDPQ